MSRKRKDTPNGWSPRALNEVRGLADHATRAVAKVGRGGFRGLSDDELRDVVVALGDASRSKDALLIEATAEIQRRETNMEPFHRVYGCASVNEFLQRTTGMSGVTAKRYITGAAVVQGVTTLQGDLLTPSFPTVTDAMFAGRLGLDGVLAATKDLSEVRHRVEPAAFDATERAMVDVITTTLSLDGYAPMADDVRRFARETATRLDRDGPKPVENEARRARFVKLGPMRNGLVPIRGLLTPDVAAGFRRAHDAMHNPRVTFTDPDADGVPLMERDDRTAGQKLHDTFATVVTVATASKELPTLGGADPTLVVTVDEATLLSGEGWARIDGDPVPVEAALHVGCAGVIQRVAMTKGGKITRIGTEERVFNRRQRRAIAARDGHCVIPGCTVPAAWCECHHVIPWRNGGRTTTDNGVLLCWYHHRYIDDGVWQLKFISGVPHVTSNRWGSEWRPTTPVPQRT